MKKRALIHVDNTQKLESLASFLIKDDWQILSANSTETFLKKANIPVTHEQNLEFENASSNGYAKLEKQILSVQPVESESISDMLNLYNGDNDAEISLVCINVDAKLYSANQDHQLKELAKPEKFFLTSILRTAYYNAQNVIILTDPSDYKEAMIQMRTGSLTQEFKAYLGAKALNLVSAYDSGIAYSLLHSPQIDNVFMNYLTLPYTKAGMLKHGSNKSQPASIYYYPIKTSFDWGGHQFQTEDITYNTINDLSLAWRLIGTLYDNLRNMFTVQSTNADGYAFTTQFTPLTGTVFTIAVKLNSIVGAALSTNAIDSFRMTNSFDKDIADVSLGFSSVVDEAVAQEIVKEKYIAIVAPDFTDEARKILSQNSNMILITASNVSNSAYDGKMINGGLLVQLAETTLFENWQVKTKNRPNQEQTDAMAFGTLLSLGTPSYSAVLLKENHIIGIAQGCTSNKKAVQSALEDTNGVTPDILVCDSPISFTDSVKKLIDDGIHAIIQPGGTFDDSEFIKYCDEHNTVMIFTNMTHINI